VDVKPSEVVAGTIAGPAVRRRRPATDAVIFPSDMVVAPDGFFYILERQYQSCTTASKCKLYVRRIAADGIIKRYATWDPPSQFHRLSRHGLNARSRRRMSPMSAATGTALQFARMERYI
jgi:hypothetical protein